MGIGDIFLQAMSNDFGAPRATDPAALAQQRNRATTNATLQRLSSQLSRNNQESNELVGKNTPIGIDAVVQDWVRQTFIFRRSILQDMFIMALQVTEIRAAILAIKRGVFKRELGRWNPKFKTICVTCGKKYQTEQETCDACYLQTDKIVWRYGENGVPYRAVEPEFVIDENNRVVPSPTRKPNEDQKEVFEEFIGDVNIFHQPLLDVIREGFEDLLVTDDLFILLNKEYTVDKGTGKVTSQRVFEVTRLHPALVEFDIDRKDGLPERSHYLCPLHRNQSVGTAPGRCSAPVGPAEACNTVMLPAMYRYYIRGHYRYYTRDEIVHKSYFSPSKTYGYSPVITIFEKVLTLLGIDRWYYRYFYERKIPPGLVITYTDDPDSLKSEIQRVQLEMLEDPNQFPWIAASARTQRGRTDNVKLGYTFEEMDSVSIRSEIRERVGNLYGVTPMQQGDARQMGGLQRESAQTSMFDDVIESYQKVVDFVLKKITEDLGITDWERVLAPANEKTEQEIMEISKGNLDIATGMQTLGYAATLKDDDSVPFLQFEYEKIQNPLMGGGMPGMGGPGMGMPGTQPPGMGMMPGMDESGLPPPPPAPLEPDEQNMGQPEESTGGMQPFPPP